MLKYKCLILDHDDTAVDSTAEIHYPAHIEIMRQIRPSHIPVSLKEWFLKNYQPGIMEYMVDELKLDKSEIEKLPKGSISKKLRNDQAYFYRAYREEDKVKFKYLGKESSNAVIEALEQKVQHKNFLAKLRSVNRDIKEIKRVLHGQRG